MQLLRTHLHGPEEEAEAEEEGVEAMLVAAGPEDEDGAEGVAAEDADDAGEEEW
jgi:hypothetical protein